MPTSDIPAWLSRVSELFPSAISGPELTERALDILEARGFSPESTLLASSVCPDELNPSVTGFADHYGVAFRMGGLAGFPFAGRTGFQAFVSHAPDMFGARRVLVVYGPHVGIDADGTLGQVRRPGMRHATATCGSLVGALAAVEHGNLSSEIDPCDLQQGHVVRLLSGRAESILAAEEPLMAALDHLYEATETALDDQIAHSGFQGQVALLGGVIINTPPDEASWVVPRRFELRDSKGERTDLLPRIAR